MDAVYRVLPAPGPAEIDLLFEYLNLLVSRPEAARELGRRARDWVAERCNWDCVAHLYADFLKAVVEGSPAKSFPIVVPTPAPVAPGAETPGPPPLPAERPVEPEYLRSWAPPGEARINRLVYKKHFITKDATIKIFVEEGTVIYTPLEGTAELELLKKRPFWFQINRIHLAQTDRLWIWISDTMAVFLLFVAISGLFLLKGKYGIKGRGLWLTSIGIVIPLVIIFFYLN